MADPNLKYLSQDNFTGGIATEYELRKVARGGAEITVSEAADVWAPNGVLKRRPGVLGQVVPNIITDFSDIIQDAATMEAVHIDVNGEVTTSTYISGPPTLVQLNTGNPGTVYIKLQSTNGTSGQVGMFWQSPTVGFNNLTSVGDNPTMFWVPSGGSVVTDRQQIDSYVVANRRVFATSNPDTGSVWAAYDVVPSGAPFYIYNSFNNPSCVQTQTDGGQTVYGARYVDLPSEKSYLSLYRYNSLGQDRLYLQKCNSLGGDSVYGTLLTSTTYVVPDPALYTQYGAPPSWAAVPEANRVYACYANQVYEYRPDLSTPFRLAQVNSDPIIVGPGAAYDSTIFAQQSSFPLANQCIYFNGLMFFTDIKDNPNVVQWGGPAIDGAVDVLPVLSYAILSDSRDNSKNVGFGVYNNNLYVFKQNSIWALIPAGQSDVDGTYQFVTRLVTSGAGCSAPSSIVSTPNGIMYYNAGGFYIFDGQLSRKVSPACKSLFDSIIPGNAYQMQACHWVQQHSYVVSCQVTNPFSSPGFAGRSRTFNACLAYDYQNDAWWMWISTADPSIFVDGFSQLVSQQTSAAWRIQDPYKYYDSDVLAKSAALPYFKTQYFGYGDSLQHRFEELRITGDMDTLSTSVKVTINEQILSSDDHTVSFLPPDYAIIPITSTILDGGSWSPPNGSREVREPLNLAGQWAQVSLGGSYGPFTIYSLSIGYYADGRNG